MITFKEYCKTIKEDWGRTSPIPKEVYPDVEWEDNFHWIDLGLPSGTLWADINAHNPDDDDGFWTYDEIMESEYRGFIPNKTQALELRYYCDWVWDDNKKAVTITSKKNNNCILLPADNPYEYSAYWLDSTYLTGWAEVLQLHRKYPSGKDGSSLDSRNCLGRHRLRLVKNKT